MNSDAQSSFFDILKLAYYHASSTWVLDYRDIPTSSILPLGANGYVRRIASNCRPSELFRPGIDVCSMLGEGLGFKKQACSRRSYTSPPHKYKATFKGTVYLKAHTRGFHRWELLSLHDSERGVIIAATCDHSSNKKALDGDKSLQQKCDDSKKIFDAMDYCDLLQEATFAVIPGGRSPATYRFMEALATGTVPILFDEEKDRNIQMPFEGLIDWQPCTGDIEVDVGAVASLIQKISINDTIKRQEACANIWENFLADEDKRLDLLLNYVARRGR